jgi:hypothetical protein
LAKIDLKKHKLTLSWELEKKRKRDNIHHHHLAKIAAREASSKTLKEMAASQKTRVNEKALETSILNESKPCSRPTRVPIRASSQMAVPIWKR